jgi:hypothetical protein
MLGTLAFLNGKYIMELDNSKRMILSGVKKYNQFLLAPANIEKQLFYGSKKYNSF